MDKPERTDTLRSLAARLSKLQTSFGPETTPWNFAAGAIFAFPKAERLRFTLSKEPHRALRIWDEARSLCEGIGRGGALPSRGRWLGGYFVNDAIIRFAVAFEHLVRHETELDGNETLEDMQTEALGIGFRQEWLTSWGLVFNELNDIRHMNKEFDGPTIDHEKAIEALTHLVEALEWAHARHTRGQISGLPA